MAELFENRSVLLIDGDCVLCSKSARFIARRDRKRQVAFANLQSLAAQRIMIEVRAIGLGVPEPLPDSVVLVQRNTLGHIVRVATKSDAILGVARLMRWPWNWLGYLGAIVPRVVRDAAYDAVARRRMFWFGRVEACALPGAELASRVIKDGITPAIPAGPIPSIYGPAT